MTDTNISAECSPAAARMRRHRQRRQESLTWLGIELRDREIDALIRRNLLAPECRKDGQKLKEALYRFFDRSLGDSRAA
jgi:hypothetical protein